MLHHGCLSESSLDWHACCEKYILSCCTDERALVQDNMTSGDMAALKRAALVTGLQPEDAMKMGLSGLSNPEATTRLHALGVPPGLLSSARNSGSLGGPSFHEQLLAATNAQRPESQSVPLMRG